MIRYIINRLLVTVPVLFVISALVFVIIQLPPGNIFDHCSVNPDNCHGYD